MRKNKIKPVRVRPIAQIRLNILKTQTEANSMYSLLSVRVPASGMNGGLPAVEKKVAYQINLI